MSGERAEMPLSPELRKWLADPRTQLSILLDGDDVAVFANGQLRDGTARFLEAVRQRQDLARRKAEQ